MIDTTDHRTINELPCGFESKNQEVTQELVRSLLWQLKCNEAHDINQLGCTGVAARWSVDVSHIWAVTKEGEHIDDPPEGPAIGLGRFIRIGLAGSGVGLPCFVPPGRYCLVHETFGGLQDGQRAWHADFADRISRDLTPIERAKVVQMERARRTADGSVDGAIRKAHAAVTESFDAPEALVERVFGPEEDDKLPILPMSDLRPPDEVQRFHTAISQADDEENWICPEHEETNWRCRYCIAQAIVEGELDPHVAVAEREGAEHHVVSFYEAREDRTVEQILARNDQAGRNKIELFVRVATFTRKLARD